MNRGQHCVVAVGVGKHFPGIAAVFHVLGAGFKNEGHQSVFADLFLFDNDLALALEHPGDAALFAEVAALFRKRVADIAHGPVAVIGGDHDQNGRAAGSVAFEHDFVDLAAFQSRPCRA